MSTGLLDRQLAFVGALREAGLPVSLAESLDAARALTAIDLLDREALRAVYAATLVKRAAWRPTFDTLFDLYFPPALGDPTATEPDEDAATDEPPDLDELRERLFRLLLDGDDAGLRRLARDAVSRLGRGEVQPGRQSWFSYRVMRPMSPQTLLARLLAEMLAGQDRGGMAEKVARQTLAERTAAFERYVDDEVRRRLAEERGVERIARTAVAPLLDQVEFLRATRNDLVQLRREVQPLARRLATRLTARRRLGRSGRLDVRRTVRASLSTGGVPLVTRYRPPRPHRPELVVLCDVSGSVASFAQFTLLLAYALREQFTKVRAFAFVDTCDEVTDYFADATDVADAMTRLVREADLVSFDGHSDYGHAFDSFARRFPDALTPRSALLVLGDGRTNYRPPGADLLRGLAGRSRHAYWLNPEPRRYWGTGDSAAAAYGEVVPMVECRNAAQLEDFIAGLLPA